MLSYIQVYKLDNELFDFHLNQTIYYQLEQKEVTRAMLIEDMQGPGGFDETDHFIQKAYLDENLVALIDYQYGYRFSMVHDEKCVWIGLFLVDQNYQEQGIGEKLLTDHLKIFKQRCSYVQLACLIHNQKGLNFWKRHGFKEIGVSKYDDLSVIVLEKVII